MEKTFEKKLLPEFLEKLAKINKKLSKYGKEITILSQTEETITVENGGGKTRTMVTVELSGPEILHNGRNVKHVGTISFKDGVKQIFNADETNQVLGTLPDESLTCDHCHINRRRIKYFFFKEEDQLLSIGSTCCIDYFGMDIERYLDVYMNAMIEIDGELSDGIRGKQMDHIIDVLVATYVATKGFTTFWVSRDKAEEQGRSSTSQEITSALYPPQSDAQWAVEFRQEIRDAYTLLTPKIDEMLAAVKAKWTINPTNDFEWNVYNNLFYTEPGATEPELREYIVSIGVVGFAIYKTFANPIRKERKVSEYVGQIGDKYEAEVTVKDLKAIFGNYGESTLVIFTEECGNELKTFTTSSIEWVIGNKYKIKGTVKSHDEFKGFKSTLLKRVTLQKEKVSA